MSAVECVGGPMDGSAIDVRRETEFQVYYNGREHIAKPPSGPPYGPGPLLGTYTLRHGFVSDSLVWEPCS